MKISRDWPYLLCVVVLFPALLLNLGLMTFIDDEGIRSLVALEMMHSGDFIVPTWHGEYYYKKPPLFNWILILFFSTFGRVEEWVARLPTICALAGFAITIYYFFRKHYSRKISFLNAFLVITCGRILFWDSMLALIDILFSWVMFSSFMIVYHQMERQRYRQLFMLTYLLAAIGFLLKGLPAVVFQGITLIVYFTYKRQVKHMFSTSHLAGIGVFILLVGSYYLIYYQHNPLLEDLFRTLFAESSKRTAVEFGVGKTLLHILTFPFEMFYHFLPWSLMILYFFRRDVKKLLSNDSFLTFNLIVFGSNILIYWISPQVYPRYLLMFTPLIFSSFLYLHTVHRSENTWQYKFILRSFAVSIIVITLGSLAPLFLERTADTPMLMPKVFFLFTTLSLATLTFFRYQEWRLISIVFLLLVFRIGFNWFVLPDRNQNDFGDLCRESTLAVGQKFQDQKLYIFGETEMQATNTFYLLKARDEITIRNSDVDKGEALWIIDPIKYPYLNYEKMADFRVRHGQLTYDIGKFVPSQ